jgi:hypothetical protein
MTGVGVGVGVAIGVGVKVGVGSGTALRKTLISVTLFQQHFAGSELLWPR